MVELEINDAVAHVRLARPAVRNALDRPLLQALRAVLGEVAACSDVRCVVLSGAGESFCAGGDLRVVRGQSVTDTMVLNGELLDVADLLATLPAPTIAALHGDVLGGGLELALACTLRVAAPETRLGFPEVRLGLIPAGGGIARLPRVVGRGAALRLLLTGAVVSASEALRIDLVDEIGSPDATARAIAANGPLAVRTVLALLHDDLDPAVAAAEAALPAVLGSGDAREGVRAFVERRAPTFTGA
jgi:enoyl-CoA hydratase